MRPRDIKNLDDLKLYYRTDFQFGSVIYLELTTALDHVYLMLFSKTENLTEFKVFWTRLHKSARARMFHESSIGKYETARFWSLLMQILSKLNPFVSSLLQREINQVSVAKFLDSGMVSE